MLMFQEHLLSCPSALSLLAHLERCQSRGVGDKNIRGYQYRLYPKPLGRRKHLGNHPESGSILLGG